MKGILKKSQTYHFPVLSLLLLVLESFVFAQPETPPPPAPARNVQLPKPAEEKLENGLRVIAVQLKGMPLVTASLIIHTGSEADPADLSGLADMTASLLTKGTKTRTAPQIAEAIEALGGTLTAGGGWDGSRLTTNVMSSRLSPAMEILTDVVRNPVFDEEEIERLRQQYLDNLRVSLNQPGTVATYVASRVIFGSGQYGHPASGTPESIPRLKREQIANFHARYYRPDNATLVIGGNISQNDAFRIARELFGTWAKPQKEFTTESSDKTSEEPEAKRRVVVIDMPEAGQAAVVVARPGIRRKDSNYFAALVSNSVLGGSYSSRLNQEIRIKRGLSYGARSYIEPLRGVGPFGAAVQTKNESAAEVASLILAELNRLANEPVNNAELVPRKAVLTGQFGRSLETTSGVVEALGSLALYGIDLSEINNYIENVQAVEPARVRQLFNSELNSNEAAIVVAGSAKAFLEPLRKQFKDIEVIPLKQLDLNSASLRKS